MMKNVNALILKRLFLFATLSIFTWSCSPEQLSQVLGDVLGEDLTSEEVAAGLKEALVKGATTGANQASEINGFYQNPAIKIPLPPEMQKVESRLRQLGLGNQVDKFVETLNRGAEEAAKEAAPIFVNAIKAMTIQDAWNILKGEEDAATDYLRRNTSAQLKNKFNPVVDDALNKVEITKYYQPIISIYNRIPGVDKLNPDLQEYVTDQAVGGLFHLIAEEEKNIRENPVARTTELLRKVFGQAAG